MKLSGGQVADTKLFKKPTNLNLGNKSQTKTVSNDNNREKSKEKNEKIDKIDEKDEVAKNRGILINQENNENKILKNANAHNIKKNLNNFSKTGFQSKKLNYDLSKNFN